MSNKPPRKKYYIQPEDLRKEIAEFQATGIASERLGEMLIQIATGLAASSRFDRRTYRDDMASDAVVRMLNNLHLVDLDHPKCNPFSYLTQIAYRVYLGRSEKENRTAKAINTYREECYSEFESAEHICNRRRDGDEDDFTGEEYPHERENNTGDEEI